MKLSDAIRLGAMLRPRAEGMFFARGGSCALGAALEAAGVPYQENTDSYELYDRLEVLFPIVGAQAGDCFPDMTVEESVQELNDLDSWTREQIADFIQEIEAKQERENGYRSESEVANAVCSA